MDLYNNEDDHVKDLKILCLDIIVDNFEKFMNVYKSDVIPSSYFEFLQRKFSEELLQKVIQREDFFIKYIDFLLNPYIKAININSTDYSISEVEIIIKRLKEIGEAITVLKLSGRCYSETQLVDLTAGSLPNVEVLTLYDTNISKDVLLNIRDHCKNLMSLDISFCDNIQDKCLELFCEQQSSNQNSNCMSNSLQHLNLRQTDITTLGVAFALKNLPNLRSLTHDCLFEAIYNLHFEDVMNNATSGINLYKLEELSICELERFPDVSLDVCASVCPHVKKLSAAKIISQPQMDSIIKFRKLKQLFLGVGNESITLCPFIEQKGQYLDTIDLQGGKISAETLLQYCPMLKSFSLNYGEFHHLKGGITGTHILRYLNHLTLNGLNFTIEENAKSAELILSCSPNLEKLSLCNTFGLDDELIKSFIKLPFTNSLYFFDVDFSDITIGVAKNVILAMPNLHKFSVKDCNFTAEEFEDLQTLRPTIEMSWRPDFSDQADSDVIHILDDEYDDYFDYPSDNPSDYYYDFSDIDAYEDYD